MIASTPVARWDWGRDDESADALLLCLRDLLTARSVLAEHRLADGAPTVRVSVKEAGRTNTYLFQGELAAAGAGSPAESAEELARQVRAALRPGALGGVSADIACTGTVAGPDGEVREESLLRLGAHAAADFVSVDLVTCADVWMPYDLRGRPQPAVYEANAPRLAAVLRGLEKALESETEPDDPTYFGKPTETGVENRREPDGTPSDVWTRFEIPSRTEVFRQLPSFRPGYRRTTSGDVQYVPVRGEHGVLGYLWASDADNAASFEPRAAADDEGRRQGLALLDRLADAYARGLSPSRALAELTGASATPSVRPLPALRDLAQED
ncbi:hypothetical protein ABT381_29370 [Streptomyces sp. NPDC000151]|uniref:hypothetical protein n=1 Tax=Streptomyces sp. NPDC000151 TaxID=3154244 RepID=UPI003325D84C